MSISSRKFMLLVFLSAIFGQALPAEGAQWCSRVYSQSSIKALQVADLAKIEDLLTRKLLIESERKQRAFRNERVVTLQTEAVVVGAGLHASIFAATAAQEHRAGGLLILEGGDVVSKNFGEAGGTFRINSRELPSQSTNTFSGSPLQMKELSKDTYPDSMAMSMMALGAMYSSDVPVLFNSQVKSVTKTSGASSYRYRVETSNNLIIQTNQVFFATGLGAPNIPLKDPGTLALARHFSELSQKNPRQLLPLMLSEDFHRMLKLQLGHDLKKATEGKSFAVIGQGDGGKIAVEAMLSRFSKNIRIEWIGMPAQTRAEYEKLTWERYHGIGAFMGSRVFGKPGRAEAVSQSPSGKYIVRYDNGKTVEVDHVIMATGFRDVIPDMLKEFNGSAESQVTKVPVQGSGTVIGSQVAVNGEVQEGLYVIGPAAGALATEAELKATITENPVSIEVLGPRTARMTQLLPKNSEASALLKASATPYAFDLRLSESPDLKSMSSDSLRVMLKLEMTKALRSYANADLSMLRFEIRPEAQGAAVMVYSVQKKSLSQIQRSFEADPFLQNLLSEIFRRQSSKVTVEIPMAGRSLKLTDISIQTGLSK